MKRKIIDVKKQGMDPESIFGKYERRKCDITIIEDEVKKIISCYMDEEEILNYLHEFESYLNERKKDLIASGLKGTLTKRIRNNLFASPIYIIAFAIFFIFKLSHPVLDFFFQFAGFLMGFTTGIICNKRSLYTNPQIESQIKNIEKGLSYCLSLKNESTKRIENKDIDNLARKRILHQTHKRKNELRNRAYELELKQMKKKIERRIKEASNLEHFDTEQEYLDIPDYLKGGRGK